MRTIISLLCCVFTLAISTNAVAQYSVVVSEYATDIVPGITTYRLHVEMANADDFLSSVFGNSNSPLNISSTTSFYNDQFGSSVASSVNPLFYGAFPTMAADSWVTIGIEGQNVGSEVPISTVESPCLLYTSDAADE